MNYSFHTFFISMITVFCMEANAQQASHVDGIEFQMGRDEQSLVLRTYDHAKSFQALAQKEISALDKKIASSSGAQLATRKARRARIQTMNTMINGCLIPEWHKLEGQRAGTAEPIDQLIKNFQNSLQE